MKTGIFEQTLKDTVRARPKSKAIAKALHFVRRASRAGIAPDRLEVWPDGSVDMKWAGTHDVSATFYVSCFACTATKPGTEPEEPGEGAFDPAPYSAASTTTLITHIKNLL